MRESASARLCLELPYRIRLHPHGTGLHDSWTIGGHDGRPRATGEGRRPGGEVQRIAGATAQGRSSPGVNRADERSSPASPDRLRVTCSKAIVATQRGARDPRVSGK